MPVDLVTIYNMALSSIGTGSTLQSTSEKDAGAEQCNIWYESVRDEVQSAAPWPSLTRFKRLGLLAERDNDEAWVPADPPPGYLFAYGVPADYLWPRYLTDFSKFEPSTISSTLVIAANVETPIFVYTGKETNPAAWDVNLRKAIVFGLASRIAFKLTGKESTQVNAYNLANDIIMDARTTAMNQMQRPAVETIPEWIAVRGSSYGSAYPQFVFPSADFVMSGFNSLA